MTEDELEELMKRWPKLTIGELIKKQIKNYSAQDVEERVEQSKQIIKNDTTSK